ncbi:hypothetical protein [Nannocystis punicea]|uniref:Uncharacterized protein n=1 Tax=Nannocystis punicea TaxID=2995304 RepID=A0ABY7GYT3_9BACT|nr:hypothetical protein [Nannocystis poenicansa]WAS92142.1 hypothetical protein O0S08_38665 [Nannocystis poenicansa]
MLPRGLLRPAVLALSAGLLSLGCRPDGGPMDEGTGSETGTGSDSDTGEVPDPGFLNPALGAFNVASTQHVPKDIVVQKITLGNTQLLIDGQTAGTLGLGSALGELTGDRLRIFLHGALAVGTHTLQLASHTPDGPRFSAELTMNVTAPDTPLPQVWAELDPEPRDGGAALLLSGAGPDTLLGVLAGGIDPTLRLYRVQEGTWPEMPILETSLQGHVPETMALGPGVAAAALPPTPGSDIAVVRVAYRRGVPGDAVVTRDITLAPEPNIGPLQTAVDLSAGLFRDAEFAALGRPFLLGDVLFAEFLAADDAETAHPGDRGIAYVRRSSDRSNWSIPERVPTAKPLDLDALGPALSLPHLNLGAGISVRLGQRLTGLLTLSDAGAALISAPGEDVDLLPGAPAILSTISSSLGARTVAAVTPDRGVGIAFLGTSGKPKNTVVNVPADKLPDARLTAQPGAGVVLGYSAFLLPYGDAAPVHLVLGDGMRTYVIPLDGPEPLSCRSVVLMPSLDGNRDEPIVPLACLQGDSLRIGALKASLTDP